MFYLTTAIDYTNGSPHIGHAYEKVLADVIARYRRLRGEQVYFLTGVDQHGQKVQQTAEKERITPEDFVKRNGLFSMYDSLENRKSCCQLRKVEPLNRALALKKSWLTGLRREQASSRTNLGESEFDAALELTKFNPLLDWTYDDVWQYIRANDVPYNALHDHGFPSIGCEPCTRAVKPGEDPRAGRWWWEQAAEQKECGLHVNTSGLKNAVKTGVSA